MANAATGIEMKRETPSSSIAAPMPANSDTTNPTLATTRKKTRERGQSEAELFADQRGQAFAGERAEPGAHLLHHDQTHRHEEHHEQRPVLELCPRGGIGDTPPHRCLRWPR